MLVDASRGSLSSHSPPHSNPPLKFLSALGGALAKNAARGVPGTQGMRPRDSVWREGRAF